MTNSNNDWEFLSRTSWQETLWNWEEACEIYYMHRTFYYTRLDGWAKIEYYVYDWDTDEVLEEEIVLYPPGKWDYFPHSNHICRNGSYGIVPKR